VKRVGLGLGRLVCLVSLGAIAAAFLECGGGTRAPSAERAPLDGAVACVGNLGIQPSLVSWVAVTKGVSARAALNDLVDDALAAEGASARGFDADPTVSWEETTALAGRVPARFSEEAAKQGPPTADELSTISVVHAVVMRSPTLRDGDALAIVRSIRQAVTSAPTADEFVRRANAVPHPHANLVAQSVGPFAADGASPGGGELDPGFVAAAFALTTPLELSPIIATPFGWHVLQLVERTPPAVAATFDSRKKELAGAILRLRSRTRLDALLRALRSNGHVETAVAADELMARATASP
jgi:hypothetical protein